MGLTKHRIGKLVESYSEKCGVSHHPNVSGINIDKKFVPSKNVGADTSKYLVVPKGYFACNLMHVGRDEKLPIAMNTGDENIVVSPAYFVFRIIDEEIILKEYFYILLNSPEFDRYTWFCTDSSVRGGLEWDRFCDITINLPDLATQQKYVNIYKALVANQQTYEKGLDDLKLTCDAYIENLRRELPLTKIGQYIEAVDERNTGGKIKLFQGVNVDKQFIPAKRVAEDFENGKIVRERQFAYNKVLKANGTKLPIALKRGTPCVISGSYQVFRSKDEEKLISEYLMMWIERPETQRNLGFISWGSTRDVLQFETLGELEIPIPSFKIQKSIIAIYNAYIIRREINKELRIKITKICSILIRGSLEGNNNEI